ncbi:hypothetical protein MVEN_02555700 [Mycena venus]|uniref:DUF6534 domain-containing protein n=1 Tax=Mycena venus TaxID=2733690 RepID=A0A8H6TZK8_9AGAR|nr:hypothetical protein MVEN_02555700 [Mycena venus]
MAPNYPPGYLDATAQPLMIGFMLSAPLYGIAIAQAIYYFRTFGKDVIYVKLVFNLLRIIDTAHLILLISTLDNWLLVDFFNPPVPKSLSVRYCVVNPYYSVHMPNDVCGAHLDREFQEDSNDWSRGCTCASSFQCVQNYPFGLACDLQPLISGSGIVQTIETYVANTVTNILAAKIFQTAGRIELSSSVACDFVIMGAMMYFLKVQANSAVERTTQVVNKIVIYVISAGLLTSAFTLANLILWLVIPDKLYWGIFELLLSKIYFNSLLVMLNSRVKLREQLYGSVAIELNTAGNTSRSGGGSTRNTANGWGK